ncbi:MAG: hypothetical protein JWR80_4758 [Bradyrhizobium sp.]|nr:hypothetical protein [Bradyrhizobium sp.]
MQRLLLATATLLLGAHACLAQVSTMGTTAMGLPSTPAAIVTSPLYGPSPFSSTVQPGTPGTTLAPVPLASDPTIPGTVLTCSTPTGQITPGTPTATVISATPFTSATGATVGTTPSNSAAPTTSVLPPIVIPPLTFSQQPETSAATVFPGSTLPVPQYLAPPQPQPSMTPAPVPVLSTIPGTVSTYMPGATAMTASTTMMSPTAMTPAAPLGTIPSPIVLTTTGTISPTTPLGSPSTTVCSTTPGGPPTNGAALPLSTPQIATIPSPGTIQSDIPQLVATSLDTTTTVMPTPNTSACAESMTMNLAAPGTMAPANATGAAATPGVSPPGC